MWNYLWGYSAAQIELAAADCPLVLYDNKGKDGKPTASQIKDANERWQEKYGKGEKVDLGNLMDNVKWQS